MNKSSIALFAVLAPTCAPVFMLAATSSENAVRAVVNAPLRFEPTAGGYVTRGLRFSSRLDGNHIDLQSNDQRMRITFSHAAPNLQLAPGDLMRTTSNVIHGNDRTRWRTVPNYSNLRARDLYPGIDLVYYGNHGELEYDLIVKPGANPNKIRLQISGVTPKLDSDGNLIAAFIQKRPIAYQIGEDGSRTMVASRYRRNLDGTFGFALGSYDKKRDLVIDPTLTYSLYISGSSQDTARAIGHDPNGFIYVAGVTLSTDFEIDPNTGLIPGGPQFPSITGGYDLFIAQINPNIDPNQANPVGFATYLGGSGDDVLADMFVGPTGLVYLTGYTKSTDFPAGTVAGYQTTMTGKSDAFVVVYDATQQIGSQLVYSSYFGGGTGTAGNGVSADAQGRVYIAGTTNSSEVPVRNGLPTGLQGGSDAFVAGFDPSQSGGNSLFFSTFLGGSGFEQGNGITAAADGTLWVVGQTYSPDFPLAGNSYQLSNNGGGDAFAAQIRPTDGALLYATLLGGSGIESAQRVALDAKGRVIVAGYTSSSDFPITPDAVQSKYTGPLAVVSNNALPSDIFITVLNPAATGTLPQLVYSTYYGGSGAEFPTGLVVDSQGTIYVTGYTGSPDLAVSSGALMKARAGGSDGFVLKVDPTVAGPRGLVYASYIASTGSQTSYGVDVNAKGIIYVVGSTSAAMFDPLNGVGKATAAGDTDAYLMGFNPQ